MTTLRDALIRALVVSEDAARRAEYRAARTDQRHRDRKHRVLASRERDAQMTQEEIAAEILHAARNAR